MNANRKIAVIVGALFVSGLILFVLSRVLTESILSLPDYLTMISAKGNRVLIGGLLVLVSAFTVAAIPVLLYPVFKRLNETLALGYVVARIMEAIFLAIMAIATLSVLTVGQEIAKVNVTDASGLHILGALWLSASHWSQLFSIIISGPHALLFYYLLYRSMLTSRFLSVWGLIAAPMHLAGGILCILGFSLESTFATILLTPLALNELFLGIWLICKGFNACAINSVPAIAATRLDC